MSASGTTTSSDTQTITQTPYTLTDAEQKNIFAITSDKIAGATSSGVGGYGYGMGNGSNNSTGAAQSLIYTTIVGGTIINNSGNGQPKDFGNPFATPSAGSLVTDKDTTRAANANAITINQNYLPLGITSAVKDAYFNHNGII